MQRCGQFISRSNLINSLHSSILSYSSARPLSSQAQHTTTSNRTDQSRLARRRVLPPLDVPPYPTPQRESKRPVRAESDVAPNLPLITRERNFLIADLHSKLYHERWESDWGENDFGGESEGEQGRPTKEALDELWQRIAAVLVYPSTLPNLPRSQLPLSSRPDDLDADARTTLSLSLHELYRAFSLFSTSTPTKANLAKLLVLAELIAIRSSPTGLRSRSDVNGRKSGSFDGELSGGGAGLRPKDWRALLRFTGLSYRHPAESEEVKNVLQLLNQSQAFMGSRLDLPTYNILLQVAARGQLESLYDGIVARMQRDGHGAGDLATLSIQMTREFRRGNSFEMIWDLFIEGLKRHRRVGTKLEPIRREEDSLTVVFNTMAGILSRLGYTNHARKLLMQMKARNSPKIRLAFPLAPAVEPDHFYYRAPGPSRVTYALLIQMHCYRGELEEALVLIKEISSGVAGKIVSHSRRELKLEEQHFTALFRSFAHYLPPLHPDITTPTPLHLSGPPTPASRSTYFASIPRSFSDDSHRFAYTRKSLNGIFELFLSQPFYPPHPKTLFWIIVAYEKAYEGNCKVVLDRWRRMEEKWGSDAGWKTGMRVEKRIKWWEDWEYHQSLLNGENQ